MRFSERLGYKKPKMALQIDKVDDALKAGLWNCIDLAALTDEYISGHDSFFFSKQFDAFTLRMWHSYFSWPVDTRPKDPTKAKQGIRDHFFSSVFPETYDVLEFIVNNINEAKEFRSLCNNVLEREKSAFRFVGGQPTQITGETEIEEIEAAQGQHHSKSVSTHIASAVALYSNRADPDYRNSIKESISAVEAAARKVLGDEKITLGAALKKLEKEREIHPSLKNGLSSLYGWANDSSGIRHAKMDEENLTEADARYMLISCSAFANYLLSKI